MENSESTIVPAGYNQKSKVAAGVLALLLGPFGIYNFYLGFYGKAVIQLLMTALSLGLLAVAAYIWAIVEGILILSSAPGTKWSRDAKGVPLR